MNQRRQIFDIYVSKEKIWLPSIELINLGPILDTKYFSNLPELIFLIARFNKFYGEKLFKYTKDSSKTFSKIWIAQPFKDLSTLEFSASNTVRVLHSGHVFWKQFRRFALSCDMQIDAYPFTAQNCPIKFASVGTSIKLK